MCHGATYSISVTQTPAGCTAGEVCTTQPVVTVLNSATGQVEYGFSGSVFVSISSTPTGYDSLYYGGGCGLYECREVVVGSSVFVPFVNGYASFSVSLVNFNSEKAFNILYFYFISSRISILRLPGHTHFSSPAGLLLDSCSL